MDRRDRLGPGNERVAARVRVGRAVAAVLALSAILPGVANADVKPLGLGCAPKAGVLFCDSTAGTMAAGGQSVYDPAVPDTRVASWDGTPLDANVTLPPDAASRLPLPLLILIGGYTSVKAPTPTSPKFLGFSPKAWALRGYAVLTYSSRGQGDSCGSQASQLADPAGCAKAWHHMDDVRYEAHDTQWLAGLLADEGIIKPQHIGVTGISWGGGQSIELAMLRDRVVLPDGSYVPWVSPRRHLPMRFAAAAPYLGWTDMIYAVVPNGRTLDYTVTRPTDDYTPVGVVKASILNALGGALQAESFAPPPGMSPPLQEFVGMEDAGYPVASDQNPVLMTAIDELLHYHSAYYLPYNEPPAPTLFANGFTDAIFPVDEALRWINREHLKQPRARIALMVGDFGHQPAQGDGRPTDTPLMARRIVDWMAHFVQGHSRVRVLHGVQARTLTCPESQRSGGPYYARSWAKLHPGEVRLTSKQPQTVTSASGNPVIDEAVDPIVASEADPTGAQCVTTQVAEVPGAATYQLPVSKPGFTLLGSPTVVANLTLAGMDPALVGQLWDVAPDGTTQTLIARGFYRPSASGTQVFQLHPAGWRFAPGHTVKLVLQGQDAPYSKPDSVPGSVTVARLQLRIPTHDRPTCRAILSPAPPFVPRGGILAPGVTRKPPNACR